MRWSGGRARLFRVRRISCNALYSFVPWQLLHFIARARIFFDPKWSELIEKQVFVFNVSTRPIRDGARPPLHNLHRPHWVRCMVLFGTEAAEGATPQKTVYLGKMGSHMHNWWLVGYSIHPGKCHTQHIFNVHIFLRNFIRRRERNTFITYSCLLSKRELANDSTASTCVAYCFITVDSQFTEHLLHL